MAFSYANHLIDSLDHIDLRKVATQDIRWRYGTFRPYSTGSGRDKKHFSRSGVATSIGDIREDLWYQAAEHIAERDGELWLVDALTQWNREHNYKKDSPTELRRDALRSYSYRIFDDPQWVLYVPFNRRYRPQVLELAQLVTILCDCCKLSGETTREQIDRAQQGQICCPCCGRWSTFTVLSEESPPWEESEPLK